MFFPSPSTWKMVKYTPNHVLTNMIGLAQTSREILEDGDVTILPVVLSTPDSLQFNCDCTGIPLSIFCMEFIRIWIRLCMYSARVWHQDTSHCSYKLNWKFYTACRMGNESVAPTIPGFQGIKRCIQYLASHPHKSIFYTLDDYDDSNVIILTWIRNKLADYRTHNCLECHQYADHVRILNIDVSFKALFILFLELHSTGKYI